jgi:hypothetical protein
MEQPHPLDPRLLPAIRRHAEFWAGRRSHLVKVNVPAPAPAEAIVPAPAYDGLDWERDFDRYVEANVHNARAAARQRLALALADDWLPAYHPYFGISIHHSFFGGPVTFSHGTSYAEPVITRAAEWAQLRPDTANPWLRKLARGLAWCRDHGDGVLFASYRGGNGPLDMVAGVLGNALYTEAYDDPANLRRCLDVCTDAVLATFQVQRQSNSAVADGRIVPMGALWVPDAMIGHVSLDAACLGGPAMFEAFERPWLERLAAATGGLVIHTHMLGRAAFPAMCQTPGIRLFAPVDDPNQPALLDELDTVLAAAGGVPLMLHVPRTRFADVLPRLAGRRAVITLSAASLDEARAQLDEVNRRCPLAR